MDQENIKYLISIGIHEAYEYKRTKKNNNCECGGDYIDIDYDEFSPYRVCNGCGYMLENFKLLGSDYVVKKSYDFPLRIERNVRKFNYSLPFDENLLTTSEINYICFIMKNTRLYLQEYKRVKMFHTKYLLYIILDYMGKQHLLKYFHGISETTENNYRSILCNIYTRLQLIYLKNNAS